MIKRNIFVPFIAVLCLAAACTDAEEELVKKDESDRNKALFCQAEQVGVYRADTPLWTFDPAAQQLAFCERINNDYLYMETDDEKQMVSISLPASLKSAEPGANVQIHVACRNVDPLQPGAFSLEVVQRDKQGEFPKVWLWNESSQTGFILYTQL